MHVNLMVLIPAIVLGLIGSFLLLSTVVITQQKSLNVIAAFGKYKRMAKPGLSFKAPWPFESVVGYVSLKIDELIAEVGVKTKDNAFLAVPVKVQFQVIEEKAKEAFYELENPKKQIGSYIVNVILSAANGMLMDEVFQGKEKFQKAVKDELEESFTKYGYTIVNVLVDDPQPTAELKKTFDRVLASKRELEAAENEAASTRTRMVGEATAEAESLTLKATAYVSQRKIITEGIAAAMKNLEEVDGISNENILTYLEGIDMRDTIRDASKGAGSLILIPTNMGTGGDSAALMAMVQQLLNREKKSETNAA